MPSPIRQTFRVTRLVALRRTVRGNACLECETDRGVVAFWGDESDRRNIRLLQQARRPASVTCGCLPSNWAQHTLWIPQHAVITIAGKESG